MGRGADARRGVPVQVELGRLLDRVAFAVDLLLAGRVILTLNLWLLLESALESVAVAEEPRAGALRFIVSELALEVDTVGINPLAGLKLTIGPLTTHFHASLLEHVAAITLLLAVLPPAGVHVSVLIREHALTVATAVLPVAMELTDAVVDHFANATLVVLFPAAFVAVARLLVAIDASAGTDTINEVALINVTVLIVGRTLTSETTR